MQVDNKILEFLYVDPLKKVVLPFVSQGISCGFPSPAEGMEEEFDLLMHIIKDKNTTFFARVRGDSMSGIGMNDGDIVVVDKSLEPENNKVAVCFVDGEFTIKRIVLKDSKFFLVAENEKYQPIEITEDNNFVIWGIVTNIIKKI